MKDAFTARHYARIFFDELESYAGRYNIKNVLDEMEKFCNLLHSIDELKFIIYTKKMPRLVKQDIWGKVSHLIDVSDTMKSIMDVLILNSKSYIIDLMLIEFKKLYLKSQDTSEVFVTLKKSYSNDFMKSLDVYIKSCLPFKSILQYKIDPKILGGMILDWNSNVLDLSINSKMQKIYKFIITN